jgi:Uma2 family endonuclease
MRRMTLDEFLRWEDGSDTRCELIDGVPMAMALPARAHGILSARLAGATDAALRARRPCAVQTEAGIARPDRADTCYIADLAVTCRAHERGEPLATDPILVVEILSPGTERHDRQVKVPAYCQIDSVEEILLIDSESLYAEILRRDGERWIIDFVRGADGRLFLATLGLRLDMAALYDGIDIASD